MDEPLTYVGAVGSHHHHNDPCMKGREAARRWPSLQRQNQRDHCQTRWEQAVLFNRKMPADSLRSAVSNSIGHLAHLQWQSVLKISWSNTNSVRCSNSSSNSNYLKLIEIHFVCEFRLNITYQMHIFIQTLMNVIVAAKGNSGTTNAATKWCSVHIGSGMWFWKCMPPALIVRICNSV